MTDKGNDEEVPRVTEQMREVIAEEVGKAIENSLSGFIDKIQNMVLSVVDARIKKLEDNANLAKEKLGERKGCSYKEFMACKPPLYHGEVDPIVCQRWLSDLEGVFERTHCDISDFVAYGTGQLRGQAKDWWDNKKKEIGSEETKAMTWDEFKVPFLKHHSPKAVINRIKEEFIQLRQKGESIDKITGTFLDKLRFCDELVTTEEQKVYYYYNMLSAEYREFMTPSKYETLTEIINAAREREIELKKQVERGERRTQVVNPSPTKKARVNDSSKKQEGKSSSPSCKVCGKGHKGECRFKDKPCPICGKTGHTAALCPGKVSVCYKCYQPGHKKSECPELSGKREDKSAHTEAPKAKARSFQLTAVEAKTELDVVSDDEEYPIDLIPMSMGEFQVVVGMDWLSRHNAKVMCFRKEIKLKSPSGKSIIIRGEKEGKPVMCSMIKAYKLMKHGCRAFMIYANEPSKGSLKIEDVPVVREYADVFPEDLPGIPPEREVVRYMEFAHGEAGRCGIGT
ncbi:uncharacterized protein LOC118481056 [Helianthus annuus]|uniref:uncharacterized protein LOC118481056 n=1 Tax=Helianthus annuus TaxID=4232 RepID=UPI0016530C39|nr:uncharacterized protein LOC118481056 [Helianthus annuus]